ncbi:MAG TPA: carboxypeptidase regulatory-like domain-containing protein [Terriglobales bacterium]|nr:carboxypeptidase regulatory-like domain-containing protein [Terriglobales bacterium]
MNRVCKFKGFIWALSVCAVIGLSFSLAYGQAISGNVVGTVVDSSGAAVPNADISARNTATGVAYTGKTNNTGEYRFDNLPIGSYEISARATGFQTTTLRVDVQLNKSGTANITLTPGSTNTTIEVSGVAETLDTTTAQIQTTYESKMIDDLPTANLGMNTTTGLNLGVLNLSMLDAGVSSSGGLGAGVGPALSGERPRNNNFTIEGVDNNNKGVTGPLVYVPSDAVANFTVLQNQFSPEFGHSNGGQFNIVVKGGTNDFHGTAYEYFQNRNLNAIDQSVVNSTAPGQAVRNPRFDSNRYGGQFGGPIIKNKLFFFANFEYNEVGQASVPGAPLLAPTSAGYTALLGIPGVSAANVQALQKYAQAPSATSTVDVLGVPIPVGTLPILAPNFTNFKALTTAMDYNISERDQIRGRYIYNQSSALDTAAQLPVFFTPLVQPFHLATISEYHTFTPSITNEFRVGFNRFAQTFVVGNQTFLPTLDQFPNITINDLGDLNVGPDQNAPQFTVQNTYQAIDNLTWVKGPHTLTFGGEYRKYITPQKFIQRSRGDYVYTSLEQFARDQVPGGSVAQRSFGNVGYSGDQYGIYGFVNDVWKIRRNLSLNLGLRYEYTSTPFGWTQQSLNSIADAPGLITFGSPQAPTKDFMPRVGFAYSPGTSGNTSIRGGFGMGYDVLYDNIGVLSRPPQIGSTVNCPNPVCQSQFLANGGIPPQNLSGITILDQATARANTSSFLPNKVKYPYSETWNFGIQHVFAKNYTADIRYVGTRGVHLNVQNILNFVPGAAPGHEVPTFITPPDPATVAGLTTAWASAAPICNVPGGNSTCPSGAGDAPGTLSEGYNDTFVGPGGFFDPAYFNAGFQSPITAFIPLGASTYHGLQTQLDRRFGNGLQFQVAYTFSHNIDNSTADFFSTIIAPRRPQDFRNLQAERSNSILDHRHRLTIATLYDVQWYKHDPSWFKRNLLGNYEIAPVFTWESGQWGTVQSGLDSNLNADAAPDRAIFNPAGTPGVGSDVVPLTNNTACGLPPCIVGWQAVNPNAQYIVAGFGTVPTAPRNTIQTPPINNWDITLVKHIYATERVHLEMLASFLNAFNHPQFVTGSPNQGQPISDTGSQRNFFIPSQPNFENARLSFPSNARQTVLGLKIVF